MEYVMKLTMMRVEDGPKLLNRDVPMFGRIRFRRDGRDEGQKNS